MALEFKVVNLKKDLNNRHYVAGIEFQGREGNYEIHTNANIRCLEWIDTLSILNGMDMPFDIKNGEELYLTIKGTDSRAQKCEKELEKAFIEFIREECSEKT